MSVDDNVVTVVSVTNPITGESCKVSSKVWDGLRRFPFILRDDEDDPVDWTQFATYQQVLTIVTSLYFCFRAATVTGRQSSADSDSNDAGGQSVSDTGLLFSLFMIHIHNIRAIVRHCGKDEGVFDFLVNPRKYGVHSVQQYSMFSSVAIEFFYRGHPGATFLVSLGSNAGNFLDCVFRFIFINTDLSTLTHGGVICSYREQVVAAFRFAEHNNLTTFFDPAQSGSSLFGASGDSVTSVDGSSIVGDIFSQRMDAVDALGSACVTSSINSMFDFYKSVFVYVMFHIFVDVGVSLSCSDVGTVARRVAGFSVDDFDAVLLRMCSTPVDALDVVGHGLPPYRAVSFYAYWLDSDVGFDESFTCFVETLVKCGVSFGEFVAMFNHVGVSKNVNTPVDRNKLVHEVLFFAVCAVEFRVRKQHNISADSLVTKRRDMGYRFYPAFVGEQEKLFINFLVLINYAPLPLLEKFDSMSPDSVVGLMKRCDEALIGDTFFYDEREALGPHFPYMLTFIYYFCAGRGVLFTVDDYVRFLVVTNNYYDTTFRDIETLVGFVSVVDDTTKTLDDDTLLSLCGCDASQRDNNSHRSNVKDNNGVPVNHGDYIVLDGENDESQPFSGVVSVRESFLRSTRPFVSMIVVAPEMKVMRHSDYRHGFPKSVSEMVNTFITYGKYSQSSFARQNSVNRATGVTKCVHNNNVLA